MPSRSHNRLLQGGPISGRQRQGCHRGVPRRVVGREAVEAREFRGDPTAGLFRQCVRVATKSLQAHGFEKLDRRRHRQISRRIVRAWASETTTTDASAAARRPRCAFPNFARWRIDFGLATRIHIQEAASERSRQPLVATRAIVIAVERIEFDGPHCNGMRTIDANCNSAASRPTTDFDQRKNYGRRTRDVACDDQLRPRRDGREDPFHDVVCGAKRIRQRGDDDLRTGRFAATLPDAQHRTVLIGRATPRRLPRGGSYRPRRSSPSSRSVRSKCSADVPTNFARAAIRRVEQPFPPTDEKVHRVRVQLVLKLPASRDHRVRRRAERSVIQNRSCG